MSTKQRVYEVIFEAETPMGKLFDVLLIGIIVSSVVVVMLDTVSGLQAAYGDLFFKLEWLFTIIFSVEYGVRLWVVRRPTRYAFSFFGIIDLLAILPSYLSLLIPGTQYLLVIRLLRVLRIFRILKLVQYVEESSALMSSLIESARKIFIFIFSVVILVVILGALMYCIEGGDRGFTSIPKSVYWAIVTLTTVGYGDIAPTTSTGQFVAALIMLLGYGIIAVPAGIVTSELSFQQHKKELTTMCSHCSKEGHDRDALCCKYCGENLRTSTPSPKQNKAPKNQVTEGALGLDG